MSDLVRNPKDRFSHNEAQIMVTRDKTESLKCPLLPSLRQRKLLEESQYGYDGTWYLVDTLELM